MLADSYAQELDDLLNQLECHVRLPEELADNYFDETGALPTSYDERRRFARFRFRTEAILEVKSRIPSIPREPRKHVVFSVDMSRCGFSFLHNEQLYPGELCVLWLPTRKITVKVSRARFLNPSCWLIGTRQSGG